VDFLTNAIKESPLEFTKDKFENIPNIDFEVAAVGELKPMAVLLQTGYLTIDKISLNDENEFYTLKVPNLELKDTYYSILNKILSKNLVKNYIQESKNLQSAIINKDEEKLGSIIGALYAGLPAEHHQNQYVNESFYHSLLWAYCSGLVKETRAEEPGAIGDLDLLLVLFAEDTHAVIEIKYEKDAGQKNPGEVLKRLAKNALATSKEKRYGERYKLKGERFIVIGLGIFGRGQVKVLFDHD
jgi:hypothetical protein